MNSPTQLSDHPALDESYRNELKHVSLSKLSLGSMEFETLIGAAEGAYPTDVMSVLRTLSADGEVSESGGLWFLSSEAHRHGLTHPAVSESMVHALEGLPEPHPLDFDWRFTDSTLQFFGEEICVTNDQTGGILGAPSLYKYLSDSGRKVALFDKNSGVVEHLRSAGYSDVNEVDLMHSNSFLPHFHWVVADPPWYLEHYEGFISSASQLIVPGGKLFLSVLPRLTRPNASSDRFFIIELAQAWGFDLVDIHPAALRYASPPFELEALREEGLMLGSWRNGDLFSFVLSSNKPVERPNLSPSDNSEWRTIQLGKSAIRIKCLPSDEDKPFAYRPASFSGTLRLRSVSRRSPTRLQINVWTSRNIALIVSKPKVLTDALVAVSDGISPSQSLSSIKTSHSLNDSEVHELRKILELLLQDAGLAWE